MIPVIAWYFEVDIRKSILCYHYIWNKMIWKKQAYLCILILRSLVRSIWFRPVKETRPETLTFIISKSLLHCIKLARSETEGKTHSCCGRSVWTYIYVFTLNASRCSWNAINESSRSGMFLWACRGYDIASLAFSSLSSSAIPSQYQNLSARLVHLLKTAQLLFIPGGRGLYGTPGISAFAVCFKWLSNSCCWNMQQQHPSLTPSISVFTKSLLLKLNLLLTVSEHLVQLNLL